MFSRKSNPAMVRNINLWVIFIKWLYKTDSKLNLVY